MYNITKNKQKRLFMGTNAYIICQYPDFIAGGRPGRTVFRHNFTLDFINNSQP